MYEVIRAKDSSGSYYIEPHVISRHRSLRAAIRAMNRAGADRHKIIYYDDDKPYYLSYFTQEGQAVFFGRRGDVKEFMLR